jgi:hypothetical protein
MGRDTCGNELDSEELVSFGAAWEIWTPRLAGTGRVSVLELDQVRRFLLFCSPFSRKHDQLAAFLIRSCSALLYAGMRRRGDPKLTVHAARVNCFGPGGLAEARVEQQMRRSTLGQLMSPRPHEPAHLPHIYRTPRHSYLTLFVSIIHNLLSACYIR